MECAMTPHAPTTTPLLRGLSQTINSAQAALARSKAALSALQDRLASFYLPEDTNYNCFQEDTRRSRGPPSLSPELVPYCPDTPEDRQTEALDSCGHNQGAAYSRRPSRARRAPSAEVLQIYDNYPFSKDSNVCNISGELANLLKAQKKLLCQIEKLKSEIGEKSGSIDTCLKENQFFNCKFKELENQINIVKHDIDKIKKDLVMSITKDRCFSPYSPDSFDRGQLPPTPVMRHSNFRKTPQEKHYGYQDVCTPDTSAGMMAHIPRRQGPSLSMNFKGRNSQSTTFEDLIRKSKLEIDCNINNCRNNQNISSINHNNVHDHVMMDFVSLNNQIKNLRKMAEAIFKSNYSDPILKVNPENNEITTSTKNTVFQEDHGKSSKSKPIVETTLSLVSQLQQTDSKNVNKEESSCAKSSASDSDTSCCFCTEDQLPINSPERTTYNGRCKLRKSHLSSACSHNKKILSITKGNSNQCLQNKCFHRNKERNSCNTTTNNCSTYKCATNHHYHPSTNKQICSECKKSGGN